MAMCDILSMYTCVSDVSVTQISLIRLMEECNEKETLVLSLRQQCSINKKGKCFCKRASYITNDGIFFFC